MTSEYGIEIELLAENLRSKTARIRWNTTHGGLTPVIIGTVDALDWDYRIPIERWMINEHTLDGLTEFVWFKFLGALVSLFMK